jgi:hypothetical protein
MCVDKEDEDRLGAGVLAQMKCTDADDELPGTHVELPAYACDCARYGFRYVAHPVARCVAMEWYIKLFLGVHFAGNLA